MSDIHGNLAALERAEQLARDAGATRFVCLGDVIGRGDPDGCVSWVRDHAEVAIVGNRDLAYLDRVRPELQTVVRSWAHEATISDVVVTHGDPHLHPVLHSAAVRDEFRQVSTYLEQMGLRGWLFGHTHRSRRWVLMSGEVRPVVEDDLEISPGSRFVVNVGTTGLPLPGRDDPSLLAYDDVRHRVRVLGLPRVRTARSTRVPIMTPG